jgi:hypothetical protein
MRPLREILHDLRPTPEERVEHCLEGLFDPEQCACAHRGELGEREEAALEVERRRWSSAGRDAGDRLTQPSNRSTSRSSTGT